MNNKAENPAFTHWVNEYGYLATEIYEEMKGTSHLLDVEDNNHAKWHEDSLGVLIVLPYEHAMAFAAESVRNDFANSPLHNHVFSTMTELILNSVGAMEDVDDLGDD